MPRTNIRTDKSIKREAKAKEAILKLLPTRGFTVLDDRSRGNRYFIRVRDASTQERTFWFKLGWNPGKHGTSGVQIEMIKRRTGGPPPSKLTDAQVLNEVTLKMQRGAEAGATDLLLFSLDAKNRMPIACLLIPIDRVADCYGECLKLDARRSRKGASPTLWLKGAKPEIIALQQIVRRYAVEDLLAEKAPYQFQPDDALDDLAPDQSIVGSEILERRTAQVVRYVRNQEVREKVRQRAQGRCEYCDQEGFLMVDGSRYLETHHIHSLGEDGPDTEGNVIALCANDHRAAHFSKERDALAEKMRVIMEKKLGPRAKNIRTARKRA